MSEVAFLSSFKKITLNEINNGIENLDESKPTQSNDIPTKVKKKTYIFATFITKNIHNMIGNSVFPYSLKQADVNRVYKKDSSREKENCRPVSILPILSKI